MIWGQYGGFHPSKTKFTGLTHSHTAIESIVSIDETEQVELH